ncbi:MAG TPA: NYN domain-containing protein [Thermoanaerobaculia bacterium]|nr:NYN domain-containing protein [Thermoanaerobaculia bacterium]
MPYLIDGSNLLGAMRVDRHGEASKRNLVRLLASFARAKRTKVSCIFDGPEPPSFARHLGSVTVTFSGARTADDLIAERAASGRGWSVVTSDRGLAARVQRRQVEIVAPAAFLREIEAAASGEPEPGDDWTEYFSDPKNRLKF